MVSVLFSEKEELTHKPMPTENDLGTILGIKYIYNRYFSN